MATSRGPDGVMAACPPPGGVIAECPAAGGATSFCLGAEGTVAPCPGPEGAVVLGLMPAGSSAPCHHHHQWKGKVKARNPVRQVEIV